jgi:hypothetical protein
MLMIAAFAGLFSRRSKIRQPDRRHRAHLDHGAIARNTRSSGPVYPARPELIDFAHGRRGGKDRRRGRGRAKAEGDSGVPGTRCIIQEFKFRIP